ncbi:MAG: hypothetical protein ACKN9D_02860, partial [Actinomycetales bacterium]
LGDPGPHPVADRVRGEVLEPTAEGMSAGVAGQRVQPQQGRIGDQDQRADADMTPLALMVAERDDRIPGEDDVEDQASVEEVPVAVLEDQRESGLAGVLLVRFGNRAGRRGQPERAVVGLAVLVAGEPESQREDENDQGR